MQHKSRSQLALGQLLPNYNCEKLCAAQITHFSMSRAVQKAMNRPPGKRKQL